MIKIKKINEINKNNIENRYKIFIITVMMLMWFLVFKLNYISLYKFNLTIMLLPILVLITLIIHESIHVILYNYFGGKDSAVEIKKDKDLGAIIIYQKNKDVFYKKNEYIIILLMPFLLITLISLIVIPMCGYYVELLKLNMLLNILGSATDITLSFKLINCRDCKYLNLDFNKKDGVILNLYNEKV